MKRKVIVTGGAGFIGSYLVEALLGENCRVLVIDNLSNGSLNHLKAVGADPRLSIEKIDVANQAKIRPLFKNSDTVFHLAALADIVPSIEAPERYFRSNVDGAYSVMECVRAERIKNVIYPASSSCYGIPDIFPTPESAPIRTEYPYALTKYLAEQIVLHWGKIYKIRTNSLRLFNVYGPRARSCTTYGAVFKVFLSQKIHGKPFTIVGDGTQTRDFTYVTDTVDAMIRVWRSNLSGEILNVGSGASVSINQIIELLGGGPVVRIPKRPGEPDCTFADISKIRKLLGWSPKVPIEKGIDEILKHAHDWDDSPVWTPKTIARATQQWFRYLSR